MLSKTTHIVVKYYVRSEFELINKKFITMYKSTKKLLEILLYIIIDSMI